MGAEARLPRMWARLGPSPTSLESLWRRGKRCSKLWVRGTSQLQDTVPAARILPSAPRLPGAAMTQGWSTRPSSSFQSPRVTVSLLQVVTPAPPCLGHQPSSFGNLGHWLQGIDLGCTSTNSQGQTIVPSAPAPGKHSGPEYSSGQVQEGAAP